MATMPEKIDLLNSEEYWKLGQVFHFNDVAMEHWRPIRLHELHGEQGVPVNFFFIGSDDLVLK
jgi:hypothetical protein